MIIIINPLPSPPLPWSWNFQVGIWYGKTKCLMAEFRSSALVDNLSSDRVTIKILVGGNLKIQAKFKMKTRTQITFCISRCTGKSGPRQEPDWGWKICHWNKLLPWTCKWIPKLGKSKPWHTESTILQEHLKSKKNKIDAWGVWKSYDSICQALKEPKDNMTKQNYEL